MTQVTTPQMRKSLSGPTGMGLYLVFFSLQGIRNAPPSWISVHDDDVTLVHVRVHHRDAVDAEEEGRGAVLHQQLHQVQLLPHLLGGRGESGLDGSHHQKIDAVLICERVGFHAVKGKSECKDSHRLCQTVTPGGIIYRGLPGHGG